jgi:competence protein ComEA
MLGDGGSRGTAAIWIVAAVLGGIALMRLADSGGDAGGPAPPVRVERGAQPAAGPASGEVETRRIYVHVAGAVRRPGLITVPEGTRVAVALRRAGGPLRKAELSGVNLAAKLEDGQQVVVPGRAPAATGGTAPAAGSAGSGTKLSLAAATQAELEEIDGIGPTRAGRIIEFRTEQGGVSSIEELGEVDGIGEKRLETLREALQP